MSNIQYLKPNFSNQNQLLFLFCVETSLWSSFAFSDAAGFGK